MGFAGRGWSPTDRQRLAVRLALGALLVINPAYIGVFNLDFSGHTYEPRQVTVEDGLITVGGHFPHEPYDGIDCSGSPISTGCGLERNHVMAGNLTYNVSTRHIAFDNSFVCHPGGEQSNYYDRNLAPGRPDHVSLHPVPPEQLLQKVSVPESETRLPVRLALLTGQLQTDTVPPEANRIIATESGYVTLVETRERHLSTGSTIEAIVSLVGVLAGVAVLRRTYRAIPTDG